MVDLIALTDAVVSTLQAIPELVTLLANGDPTNIYGYVDYNPDSNSADSALYHQKPGTVQVRVMTGSLNESDSMSAFTHGIELLLRADVDHYYYDMIRAIVDGVPVPGDGLPWRFCPIMSGLLPANIKEWSRQTDTEGIDYWHMLVEIPESGDYYGNTSRAAAARSDPAGGNAVLSSEHS